MPGASGPTCCSPARCVSTIHLTAEAEGLSVLLPGHYASERPGVEVLAERLQQQWPDVTVSASPAASAIR